MRQKFNGRLSWLAIIAIVSGLGCLPARAQGSLAENILKTSDGAKCDPQGLIGIGCCGAPGRRMCVSTTCTSLSTGNQAFPFTGANQQRNNPYGLGLIIDFDDHGKPVGISYQSQVLCNIAPPSCDAGLVNLRNTFASQADGMDITFFATSDIHFFREGWALADQVRQVQEIGSLGKLGMLWPANIGMPSPLPSIHEPLGVVLAGDLGTNKGAEELGAFRMLWEHGTMQDSIAYPIYAGLGNHDLGDPRMFDYVGNRMCGVRMDPVTHNYSWDWNKLHVVQLNTWLGDINLGGLTPNQVLVGFDPVKWRQNAAAWLQQDLEQNARQSGRPVLIVQHYPFSSLGDGWTADNYQLFWDTIKPYNIVGVVAGHTHSLSIQRPEMYSLDSKDNFGVPKLIDNFVDGSAGKSVHDSVKGVPPGPGRGDIMAFRVTDDYMDVAALSWKTGFPIGYSNPIDFHDANLDDTSDGSAPIPALHPFSGAQSACRKRINSRFIDVDPSQFVITSTQGIVQTVTVTVSNDIPGPVALSFVDSNLPVPPNPTNSPVGQPPEQYFLNLNNKSFVDSCAYNGRQFLLLTADQPDATLTKGKHTYTLNFSGVVSAPRFGLTVITPIAKALVTSGSTSPVVTIPIGTINSAAITLYGPPNAGADIQLTQSDPANIITCSTSSTTDCNTLKFNAYGRLPILVNFNGPTLQTIAKNERGVITALIVVTDSQSPNVIQVPISVTFKAPATVTLSTALPNLSPAGSPVIFTLQLTYPKTVDFSSGPEGIVEHPAGLVSLWQTDVNGNNRVLLSRATVNSHAAQTCNPSQADSMIFGHAASDGSGICPTNNAANTPFQFAPTQPGAYYFVASFDGSIDPTSGAFAGDPYFGPASSATVPLRVGNPVASMTMISGSPQTTYLNARFDNPIQEQVLDAQGHGAAGVAVTFQSDASRPNATFSGALTSVVVTDVNGMAVSAIPTANSIAGNFHIVASTGVLQSQATMTNITGTAPPKLIGSIESRSSNPQDPANTHFRDWSFQLQNFGGPAYGPQLDSVSLAQEPGTSPCPAPLIITPFPIPVHSLAAMGGIDHFITVRIDFGSCTPTTRFTAKIGFSANGGAYIDATTLGHQIP